MKRMQIAGVALALCLPIAAQGQANKGGQQAVMIAAAKKAAAYDLKDPASAQYRNVRVSDVLPTYVCGEINAKNSYGGYVGFTPFYYSHDDGSVVVAKADDEIDQGLMKIVCAKRVEGAAAQEGG